MAGCATIVTFFVVDYLRWSSMKTHLVEIADDLDFEFQDAGYYATTVYEGPVATGRIDQLSVSLEIRPTRNSNSGFFLGQIELPETSPPDLSIRERDIFFDIDALSSSEVHSLGDDEVDATVRVTGDVPPSIVERMSSPEVREALADVLDKYKDASVQRGTLEVHDVTYFPGRQRVEEVLDDTVRVGRLLSEAIDPDFAEPSGEPETDEGPETDDESSSEERTPVVPDDKAATTDADNAIETDEAWSGEGW